jgi:hypothetical protein
MFKNTGKPVRRSAAVGAFPITRVEKCGLRQFFAQPRRFKPLYRYTFVGMPRKQALGTIVAIVRRVERFPRLPECLSLLPSVRRTQFRDESLLIFSQAACELGRRGRSGAVLQAPAHELD